MNVQTGFMGSSEVTLVALVWLAFVFLFTSVLCHMNVQTAFSIRCVFAVVALVRFFTSMSFEMTG